MILTFLPPRRSYHFLLYFRFGDEGSWRLLGFTVFAVLLITIVRIKSVYSAEIESWWDSTKSARESKSCSRAVTFVKWYVYKLRQRANKYWFISHICNLILEAHAQILVGIKA